MPEGEAVRTTEGGAVGGTTEHGSRPAVYTVPAGVLAAAVVVLLGLIVLLGFPDPALRAAVADPPPAAPVGPAPRAAAPDLQAAADRLTAPLPLASPAAWDRELPAGRPAGASRAADVTTCPHLAARLTAALGRRTSYRAGALPRGPVGCTWTAAPPAAGAPAALLAVGYLADGTAAAGWRQGAGGAPCPVAEVPAVAPGAQLARCADDAGADLTLVLPDTRRPGRWFLGVSEPAGAPSTSTDALLALVTAVQGVYG